MLKIYIVSRFPGDLVKYRLCGLIIYCYIKYIRRCAKINKDWARYEKMGFLKTTHLQEGEKEDQSLFKDHLRELMVRFDP
jgi:hypothetical protein